MQIRQVALARSTFPVGQTLMALHNKSATPSEPEIQLLYFRRFAHVHMANQRRSQRSWQSWGVRDMEYFDRNPVAGLKKPAKACRATCLTKEQWDEVLSHYQPDNPFHDFLVVMTETGCGQAIFLPIARIEGRKLGRRLGTATTPSIETTTARRLE